MAGFAALGALGKVVGLLGTVVSVAGTIAQGKAEKAAADFAAKQAEQKAKLETAAGQRRAQRRERELEHVQSRRAALAASSGLGSDDPSVIGEGDLIAQQGEFGIESERANAGIASDSLVNQAAGLRASGKAAKQGATFSAIGTLASGFGGFLGGFSQKYSSSPRTASRSPYQYGYT